MYNNSIPKYTSKGNHPTMCEYIYIYIYGFPVFRVTHKDHLSFLNRYKNSRKYIATQGPLDGTTAAFWRMMWEQGVSTIVMATAIVRRCLDRLMGSATMFRYIYIYI